MTWILILVLVGPKGDAIQIETVAAPFASYEACNEAGVEARGLPVLSKPEHVWNRIDWTCVPTGRRVLTCEEREAAREALREELRALRSMRDLSHGAVDAANGGQP